MIKAAPWTLSHGLVSDAALSQLRNRYKSIESPLDLESLLTDIGRRQPTLILEAFFENSTWEIRGTKAQVIAEIDFVMRTRMLLSPLEAVGQSYDGQVDSVETRSKLIALVEKTLQKRGFYKNAIKLQVVPMDEKVVYQVEIDEGEPCVIEKVELSYTPPESLRQLVLPGSVCDETEIRNAVDRMAESLRDLGYNQSRLELAGLTRHPSRNSATVHLTGAIGSRIRYEIEDPTKRFLIDDLFPKGELSGVDPTIVGPDAMAAELSRRYKNKGFADVQITGPRIEKPSADEVVYSFSVTPGTQYLLRNVQFEGATIFTEQQMLEFMGLTGFWQTDAPLNPEEIRKGVDILKAKYQSEGFWDAQVRERTPSRDKDSGSAQLVININEGTQRILDRIVFQGNKAILSEELAELSPFLPDSPVDRTEVLDFQQRIRTTYVEKGFLYADTAIDIESLSGTSAKKIQRVVLQIRIKEGARTKIGAIAIGGLTKTHQEVVFRELLFSSGDWYNPTKIADSRRNLIGLGLFRSVQISPADRALLAEEPEEIDLIVDVREGKPGNISFGPGWELSDGWRYSAEASYNNIGGWGRQVSLRGGFSEERQQPAIGRKTLVGRSLGAGYLEPYVLDLPLDGTVSASTTARAVDEAWELTRGGEIALTHKLKHWLPGSSISGYYGQEIKLEEAARQRTDDLLAGDVRIGKLGLRANIDLRNDKSWPTEGFLLAPDFSWARYPLGGNLRYFRWDVTNSWYFGFTDNLVAALGVHVTSYEGIARKGDDNKADTLPRSVRLFAGGPDTVRGYKDGSLGPIIRAPDRDDDDNWTCGTNSLRAGGTRRTITKAELRYRATEVLGVTGFVDSGNAFFSGAEMEKFRSAFDGEVPVTGGESCTGVPRRSVEDNIGYDYEDLLTNPGFLYSRHYLSYGTALNFLTAVGSINLAYGLPLREPKTEKCKQSDEFCFPRGKSSGFWLLRGEVHLNVSAKF